MNEVNTELKSWRGTPAKKAIQEFVATVTNTGGVSYVPPEERIAVFDNDGTLWCEKPAYSQLFFVIDRLKKMAEADPTLLDKPAYKAAYTDDMGFFATLYPDNMSMLAEIVYDTHAGMPQDEFEQMALDYLNNARHPRFDVPFKQCVYQPMLELLDYLRDHGFKVFITSAGGMSFMRTVSEEIYRTPRENVIGSNITFEFSREDGRVVLLRRPGLVQPMDDGPGKPVNIELHIGRKPIMAVGNANGDAEMLEYAQSNDGAVLCMLVHHDDDEREYAYDKGAEEVLQAAAKRSWTTISMKNDWRTMFTFQSS